MNTIDGASPEVSGKREDQEWNPAIRIAGLRHCDWAFGESGYCGSQLIKIDGSCDRDVIETAFKVVCKAARNCACKTHNDPTWKAILNQGAWAKSNYKDVWECISNICRSGGITIKCNDPDACTGSFGGIKVYGLGFMPVYGTIYLCPDKMGPDLSLANKLLHEMLHQCGVAPIFWAERSEDWFYKNLILRQQSASYWIANNCIGEYKSFEGKEERILVNSPEWWE
jgi:hypothetical protein